MHDREDVGLTTLLELDGEIYDQGDGYWVKIEARLTVPTPQIPHGIRYSLTLHDRYGTRMLGFDNAHPLPARADVMWRGDWTTTIATGTRVTAACHTFSSARINSLPISFTPST